MKGVHFEVTMFINYLIVYNASGPIQEWSLEK